MIGTTSKKSLRTSRVRRVRAKIAGTAARPRLMLHKSNYALYAQLIDDVAQMTLGSAKTKGTNAQNAKQLAADILVIAKEMKIITAVFDRRGFRYHGVIAAFVDAVREGGVRI